MGKYDDVARSLIVRGEALFPVAHMGQPRDWKKIDQVQQRIPFRCDRVLSAGEVIYFYE